MSDSGVNAKPQVNIRPGVAYYPPVHPYNYHRPTPNYKSQAPGSFFPNTNITFENNNYKQIKPNNSGKYITIPFGTKGVIRTGSNRIPVTYINSDSTYNYFIKEDKKKLILRKYDAGYSYNFYIKKPAQTNKNKNKTPKNKSSRRRKTRKN